MFCTRLIPQSAFRLRPAFTSLHPALKSVYANAGRAWHSLHLPVAALWRQQATKARP